MLYGLIGLASLAFKINCGPEMPNADVYSPKYGIAVELNRFNPDLDLLDMKYEATAKCLGYNEEKTYGRADGFIVEIKGTDGFWCGKELSPKTGRCNGEYDPDRRLIKVNENLDALSHELVHHLTGKGEGTRILTECGDDIDGMFNKSRDASDLSKQSRCF